MEFNFKSYDNSKQSISYCEVDKCPAVINLKAKNEELKKCYKNNSALLDFEETNTTKLINKVMKLEKALAEIKEIATCCIKGDVARIRMKQILQKISKCEVENESN